MVSSDTRDKVKELFDECPQLNRFFMPIVEEFFVRLEDHFDIHDLELNKRIARIGALNSMTFENLDETIQGLFDFSIYKEDSGKVLGSCDRTIKYDLKILKGIFSGDRKKIEEFINTSFHEQGHCIQHFIDYETVDGGLRRTVDGLKWSSEIIDEFAEIVNAQRLQHGNLNKKLYYGYDSVQNISRVALYSLGIDEEELGNLQMKSNGREQFEKLVGKNFGDYYGVPLHALENTLDVLYGISRKNGPKFIIDTDIKNNVEIEFDSLKDISDFVLRNRIRNLGPNPDITELAEIAYDKKKRDENFKNAVKEYKIYYGLPMKYKYDLQPEMFEEVLGNSFDKEELENEVKTIELIKKEEQKQKFSKKYDNNALIDEIIELGKDIDISALPEKEQKELNRYKQIGKIREIFRRPRKNLLVEAKYEKEYNHNDKIEDEIEKTNAINPNQRDNLVDSLRKNVDIDKIEEFNSNINITKNNKISKKIQEEIDDENFR